MVYGKGGLSGLHRGGRTFDGLGLKFEPDGSSVRTIFKGSLTEEGTISGNAIFEGGFKFSASETRKKFDRIASVDRVAIGECSGSERSSDCWRFMRNKKYSKK